MTHGVVSPDLQARAELLLLANIDIGFHEQTRLQPKIAASLEAAVMEPREFVENLLAVVLPGRGRLSALVGRILRWLLGRLRPLSQTAEALLVTVRQLRKMISEHLMTLTLPHGVQLRLGRDLQVGFPPPCNTSATRSC